jgi:hypothetical protein
MVKTFTKISVLPGVLPQDVWERIVTPEGINNELSPYVQMTVPSLMRGKSISEIPVATPLGRSWFLLFGILPFDYDELTVAELEPGRRFLEKSSMFSIRHWSHERTLTPVPGGCEVKDRVEFELRPFFARIPGMYSLVMSTLQFLFNHRHKKLLRWSTARQAGLAQMPPAQEFEFGRDN